MQHTFQVGDRVKSTLHPGAIGVLVRQPDEGWLMLRDDGECEIHRPYWWVRESNLIHDTDFQVGDWVRYEKTDEVGTEEWNGKTGIITVADAYGAHPAADVDKIANRLLQANLVKIQPPTEGHMNPEEGQFAPHVCDDAIERGIKEKIQLLERQVEKAKCCLETYRDLKVFINQGESHGTR